MSVRRSVRAVLAVVSTGPSEYSVPPAPVCTWTVIDNADAARANSDAMNAAIRAAVRRNPGAALLDLHDQLCTAAKVCPQEIAGIRVYDDTGHPSAAAHDRLGNWILNSLYADPARQRK